MKFRVQFCGSLSALCLLFCSGSAFAGIILSIDNISLTAGGSSGFANVWARWEDNGGADPPSVNIDNFSAKVSVISPGGTGSDVHFSTYFDPLVGSYSNGDHQFLPPDVDDYLFNNNSLNIAIGDHAGSVSGPGDTVFAGGDFRDDLLTDVTLDSTLKLLFRLELYATGAAIGSEVFSLQFAGEPDTAFYKNDGFTTIPFALDPFGSQGQITVTGGTAAVPEPATGIVLLLGTGLLAWRRSRNCRHHTSRDEFSPADCICQPHFQMSKTHHHTSENATVLN